MHWRVYAYFLKSMGLSLSLAMILIYGVSEGFSMGSNVALSKWSDQAALNRTMNSSERDTFLGVYAALGFCNGESGILTTSVTEKVLALKKIQAFGE